MCDQETPSLGKMSKNYRLGRLKITNSPSCSVEGSPVSGVVSPMTDLAVNLGGLSTGGTTERFCRGSLHMYSPQIDNTPKRRISWSGMDTPIRKLTDKHDNEDDHDELTSESESSFVICRPPKLSASRAKDCEEGHRAVLTSSSRPLGQIQPVTMVQFDTTGGSPIIASKSISFDKENIPSSLESAGENAQPFILSPYKLSSAVSSTLVCEESSRDSEDSGYSGFVEHEEIFQRSHSTGNCSLGLKSNKFSSSSKTSVGSSNRPSLCSMSSVFSNSPSATSKSNMGADEDGFSNIFKFDENDDIFSATSKSKLTSLSSLLSDPLTMQRHKGVLSPSNKKKTSESTSPGILRCRNDGTKKSSIRRCLSMKTESEVKENTRKPMFSSIFKSPSAPKLINPGNFKHTFKRPDPPRDVDLTSPALKRRKSVTITGRNENTENIKLHRSHSETEATIMRAVQRSCQDPDLIGDFSRPYVLPLTKGRSQDVKAVSPQTVKRLIQGDFEDEIDDYVIVDCRYPYEYQGGHIEGAKNIYTKETILNEFLPDETKLVTNNIENKKTKVIIFHCEFSSERAPSMYRFLRNRDRQCNKECYPNLYHPEIYILQGGYKAFYETHKELCIPSNYKPMVHKDHEEDLRHFRAKSKSWNGDTKNRVAVRPGLKF